MLLFDWSFNQRDWIVSVLHETDIGHSDCICILEGIYVFDSCPDSVVVVVVPVNA